MRARIPAPIARPIHESAARGVSAGPPPRSIGASRLSFVAGDFVRPPRRVDEHAVVGLSRARGGGLGGSGLGARQGWFSGCRVKWPRSPRRVRRLAHELVGLGSRRGGPPPRRPARSARRRTTLGKRVGAV